MAMSRKADVVSVEVFADAVNERLGDALRLMPVAFVQRFENQQAGTISVPSYAYIGDSAIIAEGVAIDPSLLASTTDDLPIVKVGKAVELTDEALKAGFGDPIGEAENQLTRSIANGIEREMFTALGTATLGFTTPVGGLTGGAILGALGMFGEDADNGKNYLVINPADVATVRTDANYSENEIFGCELIVSNRVPVGSAYVLKEGAIGLYLSKDVNVEQDRDILAKTTVISADSHFVTHLRDASKAVRITITA